MIEEQARKKTKSGWGLSSGVCSQAQRFFSDHSFIKESAVFSTVATVTCVSINGV